ncbi:MAG: AAA family ATPase [Pseudomonadota bacterium]|jgi:transitional endoplasmic reticulum ATPase
MSKDGRVDSYGIHDGRPPLDKKSKSKEQKDLKEPEEKKKPSSSSGAVFTPKDDLPKDEGDAVIREEKRPEGIDQPVKKGKEFSLRVAKSFIDDEGKGLARIDTALLQQLGAMPGEVLQITGRRSTVARAAQLTANYTGQQLIQIDGITRDNAQVSIDEWVTVSKIPFKGADTLLLAPVEAGAPIPKDEEIPHIRHLLSGLHVVVGDRVQIVFFGTRPQFFIVEGMSPRGCVRINANTTLSFRTSDFTHEKSSRTSYEDIGGLDVELSHVREMIELPLKFPELFAELGIDPPKGVLLSGPPGTGKTLLARTISNEVRAHFIHVNGPEVIHKFYGESEAKLRQVFEEARKNAPAIIFLDEIDALAPKRAQVIGDVEKRVVAQLLALMDGVVSRGEVVIIGATNMPELVDPALRRPGRFDREITIGSPSKDGRKQILKIHTRTMPIADDVDLDELADITNGYVGADISALCKEAGMAALRRIMPDIRFQLDDKPTLNEDAVIKVIADDFIEAYKSVQPTSTREFLIERAHFGFDDVGGLEEIKKNLLSIAHFPTRELPIFANTRLSPPKGVLLSGPSGTGKTLMARALSGQTGMTLIVVDPPTLLSKWVGETEKGLKEVFKRAKQASPCILLIDEIEAIAPARTAEDAGEVSQRIVSQLFRELDELHGSLGVLVVAATNRIDLMEPALLRAGRFDYIIEFPLPNRDERVQILDIYLKDMPLDPKVNIGSLAETSEGWSGADIEAMCKKAVMLAIDECLAGKKDADLSKCTIAPEHFEQATVQNSVHSEKPPAVRH